MQSFRNSNQLRYAANKDDIDRKSTLYTKKFEITEPNLSEPFIADEDNKKPRGTSIENKLVEDYYGYLHRNRYNQEINRTKSLLSAILAWILLAISIIGGASIGPFFLYVNTQSQLLKSAWRFWVTSFLLLPFVFWEYKQDREKVAFNKKVLFKPSNVKSLVLASLANATWVSMLVYAIDHTSIAQAYLFNNCQSFIIVFYKYFTRQQVTKYEYLGTVLASVGAIFVAFDDDIYSYKHVDFSKEDSFTRFIYGDFLAFLGSIAAASFFLINAEIKNKYPLYTGITIMSVLASVYMSLFSLIFEDATISFDEYSGLFGLFSQRWFGLFIIIGIVTGLGCYVLYVIVSKLLDSLILTISLNFEPIVSAIIVWFLGWQALPGPLTFIGACFMIPGVIYVLYGQHVLKTRESYYNFEMQTYSLNSNQNYMSIHTQSLHFDYIQHIGLRRQYGNAGQKAEHANYIKAEQNISLLIIKSVVNQQKSGDYFLYFLIWRLTNILFYMDIQLFVQNSQIFSKVIYIVVAQIKNLTPIYLEYICNNIVSLK